MTAIFFHLSTRRGSSGLKCFIVVRTEPAHAAVCEMDEVNAGALVGAPRPGRAKLVVGGRDLGGFRYGLVC